MEDFVPLSKSEKKQAFKVYLDNKLHPDKKSIAEFPSQRLNVIRQKHSYQDQQVFLNSNLQTQILREEEEKTKIKEIAKNQEVHMKTIVEEPPSFYIKIMGQELRAECNLPTSSFVREVRKYIEQRSLIGGTFCFIESKEDLDIELELEMQVDDCLINNQDLEINLQTSAQYNQSAFKASPLPLANPQQAYNVEEEKQIEPIKSSIMPQDQRNFRQSQVPDQIQQQEMMTQKRFEQDEESKVELVEMAIEEDLEEKELAQQANPEPSQEEYKENVDVIRAYVAGMPDGYYLKTLYLLKAECMEAIFIDQNNNIEHYFEIVNDLVQKLKQQAEEFDIEWDDGHQRALQKINEIGQILLNKCDFNAQVVLNFVEDRLSKVCPLNFDQILYYEGQAKKAREKVRGQDVVLLCGESGVGKSTALHYLQGNKMVKAMENGMICIKAVNSKATNIIARASTSSVTKYVDGVTIQPSDVSLLLSKYRQIFLADSAGFFDTSGAEHDIVNCIGLVEAMKVAKSVRIVLILHPKGEGTRFQGAQKAARMLNLLIKNINENIESVSYVFNGYTNEQIKNVNPSIEDLLKKKDQSIENDIGFKDMLLDMYMKTMAHKIMMLNLLDGKPENLLEKILQTAPMQNPDEKFQFALGSENIQKLEKGLKRIQRDILNAFKRQQYEVAEYLYEKYNEIEKVLQFESVTQSSRNEIIRQVQKQIKDVYNNGEQAIRRCFDPSFPLTKDDLDSFNQTFLQMQQYDGFRMKIDNELPSSWNFQQILDGVINENMKRLEVPKSLASPETIKFINKLNIVARKYPKFNQDVKQFEEKIIQAGEQLHKEFLETLEAKEFSKSVEIVKQGKQLLDGYEDAMNQETKEVLSCEKFQRKLFEYLKKLAEAATKTVDDHKSEINGTNEFLQTLSLAKMAIVGQNLLNPKQILELEEQVIGYICDRIKKEANRITTLKSDNQLNQVRESVENIQRLRNIDGIKNRTEETYQNSVRQLIDYACQKQELVAKVIDDGENNLQNIDYNQLFEGISVIRNLAWLDQLREGFSEGQLQKLSDKFKNILDRIMRDLQKANFSLEEEKSIQNIEEVLNQMECFQGVEKFFQSLDETVILMQKEIKRQIEVVANECFTVFFTVEKQSQQVIAKKFEQINLEKASLVLKFLLKACKHIQPSQLGKLKVIVENNLQLQIIQKTVQDRIEEMCENVQKDFECRLKELLFYGQYEESESKQVQEEEKKFHKNQDKQGKITSTINKLYIYLKRLKMLEEKDYSIKDIFEKYEVSFENFQQKLSKFLTTLFQHLDEMFIEKQNIQFLSTLNILKYLIELDDFLEPKRIDQKYKELHAKFSDQLPQEQDQLLEQIQNHQYEMLKHTIQDFDGNDPKLVKFRIQLSIVFKSSIDTLFLNMMKDLQECNSSYNQNEVEKYRLIQNQLEILDKALEIKEPLLNELQNQKFQQQKANFVNKIEKQIDQSFNQLESHIDLGKFFESNQQIKKIQTIILIFQAHSFYEALAKRLGEAEQKKKDYIDKILNKYSKMDLSTIKSQKPKELFERLLKDDSQKDEVTKIQKVIKDQFRIEAKQILEDRSLTDDKKRRKLEALERFTGILGDREDEDLQEIVNSHLEDFENIQKEQQEILLQLKQTENYEELKQKYEQYKKSNGSSTFQVDIINYFNDRLSRIKSDIKISSENSSPSLQEQLNQFFLILQNHPNMSVKNQTFRTDVSAQVTKLFSKHQTILQGQFDKIKQYKGFVLLQTHEAENKQDVDEEIKTNQLISPASTYEQNSNISDYEDSSLTFLLESYREGSPFQKCIDKVQLSQITQLIKSIVRYFASEQQLFQKILEKKDTIQEIDIVSICKLLKEFSKADDFIKQIQDRIEILKVSGLITVQEKLQLESITKSEEMILTVRDQFSMLQDNTIQEIYSDEIAKNKEPREHLFSQLNDKLVILNSLPTLKEFLPFEFYSRSKNIFEQIKEKASKLVKDVREILNQRSLSEETNQMFQNYYKVILSYNKCITVNLTIVKVEQQLIEIKQIVNNFILQKEESITKSKEKNPDSIKSDLIELKDMALNFEPFREQINSRIDYILNNLKSNKDGAGLLSKVGKLLDGHPRGYIILSDHSAFNGINISIMNQKFKKREIINILEELKADDVSIAALKKRYDQVREIFENEVTHFIKGKPALPPNAKEQLYTKIKEKAQKCSQKEIEKWSISLQDKIPELIGLIFAFWTILNAKYYFDSLNSVEDEDSYLLQPHAGQVVSILRILCIGDQEDGKKANIMGVLKNFFSSSQSSSQSKLHSNLVQIGTGEGKSVTLAITASILALLRFNVASVCYSEYLCDRDYKEFKSLFEELHIEKQIVYQTFNQLCEQKINEKGDIRKLTREVLLQGGISEEQKKQISDKNSILLIDEVDVFFKKDFFGNIYQPQTMIQDPTISDFIDYIWENYKTLKYQDIQKSDQYKLLQKRFSNISQIIDEQVKLIYFDIKHFHPHEYIVSEGKIGYKDSDKIEFNINYGYKTLFAYYVEHENGKITKDVLDKQKGVRLNCGAFSYAQIPNLFTKIMGVTGTLESLSDFEKENLFQRYKIGRYTFIPSAFGANQREFNKFKDFFVEKETDYFDRIAFEINARLNPIVGIKTAVLVFFETEKQLKDFYNSESFATQRQNSVTLTERDTDDDKKLRISLAATSGTITLFTTSFGRGTNFICKDKTVNNNGGAQVIITFMPLEPSEQVQLMGRTGRQGEKGGVCFIINLQSLEKIIVEDYENQIIANKDNLKDFIEGKRNDLFIQEQKENSKSLKEADLLHEQSLDFVKALCGNNYKAVEQFILKQNIGPQLDINAKECIVIICMDATGSMNALIKKTKETIHEMFFRSKQVLEAQNISGDCIIIQLACYRNYNAKEDKLLQVSPYENQPKNLETFMSQIEASYGWGDEAIEVALSHCYQQSLTDKQIQLVIVIGDAPPNSQDAVATKRQKYGENYWMGTKNFAEPKFYETEIQNLNSKNIPIYAYYVASRAKPGFEKIASLSAKGKCNFLDVNSDLGSALLVDTVTTSILEKIQEQNNLEVDLIDQYHKHFPKGYGT